MNGFVTEKEFNLIHDLINLCDENNIPRDIQYRIIRNLQFSLYMGQDVETYRQMIIAGGIPFIKEKPCKFVLETDGVTYGPIPEEDAPLLQRISMTENGHVTVTLYNWNKVKLGSESFRVDASKAASLIKDMAHHFAVEPLKARATDVGSWKLTFSCDNKEKVDFCGDLLEDGAKSLYSDKIRTLLDRENLLCLDGKDGSIRKYRICTCIFDSGENEYYYRSDDPDIKIGDTVIVPVGSFGRTSFAIVSDIEFLEEDEIDYPLDKIKFVESSLVLPKIDGKDVSLFDIVKKAIDITDCEGLLDLGSPKDEYDGESRMIAQKIAPYMDKYQIATIIADIMTAQFNEPYSSDRFYNTAEYIIKSLQSRKDYNNETQTG